MLRIPNLVETSGFSSVFILRKVTLPSYSFASSSTTGATIRQGPHQGAQKSTITGCSDLMTFSSNVSSVTSAGFPIVYLPIPLFAPALTGGVLLHLEVLIYPQGVCQPSLQQED